MRFSVREFVRICAETFPKPCPVYEFGAFQVAHQEGRGNLRPFFPDRKFVGADIREGPGVDAILDLHSIDLPSESVGAALVLETLEHVEHPWTAVREIHRILKPDGIFILSSCMNYPIHSYPHDYWRFTPEGFEILLRHFRHSFVGYAGESNFPHTIVGVAFKGAYDTDALRLLQEKIERWKIDWNIPEGATK